MEARQGKTWLHLPTASTLQTSAPYFINQLLRTWDTKNHDNSPQHVTSDSYKETGHISFAIRKRKHKVNEYSGSSHRGWHAAGGPRAGLLLSNHCTLSRPLRRVRGSLWLQDNFPQQTRSITPTECDSFLMGTAQHCPKYSFEVDGTARLVFKINSSASEPSHGSLLNESKWLENAKSRLLKCYIST